MTDHDPADRLRDAFEAATPPPPPAPDRATGARTRARTRRRRQVWATTLAVAATIAAVAAVPVVLGGSSDSQVDPAVPVAPAALTCPPYTDDAGQDGPAVLGDDVVAVRVCSGSGLGLDDAPPGTATAADAQALAALVDARDETHSDLCPKDLGAGYLLVFAHADGSTQVVRGDLYGCRGLTVGGVDRSGAPEVLDAALLAVEPQAPADDGCAQPFDGPSQGPEVLPAGATSVRLCAGDSTEVEVPADALTTGVDGLVALVNDTPRRGDEDCPRDQGTLYVLDVDYPDDSTERVLLEVGGCDTVTVGDVRHDGGQRVLDEFLRLLREQRDAIEHSYSAASPPTCDPTPTSSVAGRVADLTIAILCLHFDPSLTDSDRQADVSPEQLRVLVADIARPGTREVPPAGCEEDNPSFELVGTTSYGDTVVVATRCARWIVGDRYVTPSEAGFQVLEDLVDQVGDPTLVEGEPDQVVSAYVDVHNLGDDTGAGVFWVDPAQDGGIPSGVDADYTLEAKEATTVDGWAQAARVLVTLREGGGAAGVPVAFILVRQADSDPWLILRLDR